MFLKSSVAALAMTFAIGAAPALADGSGHGSGHGNMKHGEMKSSENANHAEAAGIINSVDAAAGKVNVTHEPVAALGWPAMTMDLPVTRRVDLSRVKAGDKVKLMLKKGRDSQFRITGIEAAE